MRGRLRGVKTRRNEDPEHRSKGPQTQDRPWNWVNPITRLLRELAAYCGVHDPARIATAPEADAAVLRN